MDATSAAMTSRPACLALNPTIRSTIGAGMRPPLYGSHGASRLLEIRQVFDIRFAVIDLGLPVLAIKAAQRSVEIDRAAFQLVQRLDVAGAFVEDVERAAAELEKRAAAPADPGRWIERCVYDVSGGVARVAGTDQRQDKVRSLIDAVHGQCFAKIRVMLRNPDLCRDIDQSADA